MKNNVIMEKIIPLGIAAVIVVVFVINLFNPESAIGWEFERTSQFNKILMCVFLGLVPLIFITGDRWSIVKGNHNFDLLLKILLAGALLVLSLFACVGWSYDHLHNPYL